MALASIVDAVVPLENTRAACTDSRSPVREWNFLLAADIAALLVVGLFVDPLGTLAVGSVAMLVWRLGGVYERRFTLSLLNDLPILLFGTVCGVAALSAVPGEVAPTSPVVGACFLSAVLPLRAASYRLLISRRRKGGLRARVVLVGTGRVAVSLADRIQAHPETGAEVIGFVETGTVDKPLPAPVLGPPTDLETIAREHQLSDVIVAQGRVAAEELVDVLRSCYRLHARIIAVPRLFEVRRMSGADSIWGVPLEPVRSGGGPSPSWHLKRLFDITFAALALMLLSPVIGAVALAVRIELGPGVLFRQTRVGLDGRPFTVRKFRSMHPLPDGVENPWAVSDSSRIGPVGQFIRRYSLDELPQLLNVLHGDMSLVGPRPERPEYVEQFRTSIPGYAHRHRVPVGLTGLAAVEGLRGDSSLVERSYFDNIYIENWSLWLDFTILARTVLSVMRGTGG